MTYPNLFIIGAPKCGTTSLAAYLDKRHDVFVCDPKEPHHFSTDIGWNFIPDRSAYLDLFKSASDAHRVVCDASVWYLYSEVAVPAILEFNPAAKFIVMVRNPVDMVISLHGEARLAGDEDIADVEAAWYAQAQRRISHKDMLPPYSPRTQQYEAMATNGVLLKRLYDRVDRHRVCVIVFDDFIHDTAGEYKRVLDFLGLPHDGRMDFPVLNAMKPLKWYRLHKLLVRTRSALKKIGINLQGTGVLELFIRLSGAKRSHHLPAAKFREMLAQTFSADINLLGQLLDRDLSPWLRGEKLYKVGS